jgi:hypothetical protein
MYRAPKGTQTGGGSVAGTIETLENHTRWEERSRERSYVHTVVSADSGGAERPQLVRGEHKLGERRETHGVRQSRC